MDWAKQVRFSSYLPPTYENFIRFVKDYLAPHMKMEFVVEDYYEELWNSMWTYRLVDAQISRGHSKSELLGVWATMYIAVVQPYNPFYKKRFGRDKKIYEQLIVSSDQTTTNELFDRVKDYFLAVDDFLELIPKSSGDDKWNNEKIELTNGSTVYARGIKMKRGLHVDRVVCDDLTSESSTLNDEETWSFFSAALLPMTTTKQAMIMVDGTPIRLTDIMCQLAKKDDKQWHHIKLPAILDWNKKVLLSPKRFSWDTLMDIRAIQGSVVFESEYMLNPIDDTTALIKREWIRQCFSKSNSLHKHRSYFTEVYLGVDFAFSDRKDADWSVFCTVGVHEKQYYLLDFVRRQGMSGMEQMNFIKELHAVYKYDLIGLEQNSIQAITKEIKGMGLPIKLFRTGNVDERNKRNPDFSGTISISKRNLVLRLAATFENKNITLPYGCHESKEKMDRLLEECVSWAQDGGKLIELGEHPDIPIALAYALEAASGASFAFAFV